MKIEETEKWKAINQISKSQKTLTSQMEGHNIAKRCTKYKTILEKDPNTFLEERKEARKPF